MASYNNQKSSAPVQDLAHGMAGLSVEANGSATHPLKYNQNNGHHKSASNRRRSSVSSGSSKHGRRNQQNVEPVLNGSHRRQGTVKFFNSQKGYGFIVPNDPSEINVNGLNEIFVHHTAIYNNGGFKSLGDHEVVEYDLIYGSKGLQAANVTGPGGQPVVGDNGPRHQSNQEGHKKRFHHSKHANNNMQAGYPYGNFMPPPFFPISLPGHSLQASSTGGSETSTPPTNVMSPFFSVAAIPMPDGSFLPVMVDAAGNHVTMPAGFMPPHNMHVANQISGHAELGNVSGDGGQVNVEGEQQNW